MPQRSDQFSWPKAHIWSLSVTFIGVICTVVMPMTRQLPVFLIRHNGCSSQQAYSHTLHSSPCRSLHLKHSLNVFFFVGVYAMKSNSWQNHHMRVNTEHDLFFAVSCMCVFPGDPVKGKTTLPCCHECTWATVGFTATATPLCPSVAPLHVLFSPSFPSHCSPVPIHTPIKWFEERIMFNVHTRSCKTRRHLVWHKTLKCPMSPTHKHTSSAMLRWGMGWNFLDLTEWTEWRRSGG